MGLPTGSFRAAAGARAEAGCESSARPTSEGSRSTEINFIGNLVGSCTDLVELMVLAAQGDVTLHTQKYALDSFQVALSDLDAGKVRGRAILAP